MKLLILLLIFCLLDISCQNNSTKSANKENDNIKINLTVSDSTNGNFINFWKAFRIAVLSNDTSKIIGLTHFPFKTRGPLDYDPTVSYNKNQFIFVFNAFLNQWDGENLNGIKELDNIKENEIPNKGDIHNEATIVRVGDLEFKRINKNWKLTFAYLDNETIDSLKKISSFK